jgi:hypothetical protein
MPGYRDRVVRIFHTKAEGGLNLNMGDETVETISELLGWLDDTFEG